MKVGDLVRCTTANGRVGLVISISPTRWTASIFIDGAEHPFMAHQLQVIQ